MPRVCLHIAISRYVEDTFRPVCAQRDERARVLETLDYITNAIPVYLNADGSATPLVHPSLGSVHSVARVARCYSTMPSSFHARSIPPPRALHARNLDVPLAPLRTPITCTFLERAAFPIFIAAETRYISRTRRRASRSEACFYRRLEAASFAPRGRLGRFYTRPSDLSAHRCIIHPQRGMSRLDRTRRLSRVSPV